MRHKQHPTTDLYFWNSCREWVRDWRHRGAIRRLGANCFTAGDRLLLLRRDEPAIMRMAITWHGHVTYLIDDDVDAAARNPSLPEGYRQRLADFAEGPYCELLAHADTVVVSSDILADQLAHDHGIGHKSTRLDPFWDTPPAGLHHFDDRATATLEMVHLGSGSHSGGLRAITPAVLRLLDEMPELRFSYVSPRGLHPSLDRHDRVRRLPVMRWPRYRSWLARQRYHLALYPLEATRFDRARSSNKLLEHCVVGAVGVYPCDWAPAAALGEAAILAPSDPRLWYDDLRRAASDRINLRRRGQAAVDALASRFNPSTQRRFWRDIFDLTI